jgi:hypothetical protein
MTYFDFFSKYSDMFYYLTFLLGVTNISCKCFDYLSYSHKYDSSQLSILECRIHMRLNDIDNKINMLYQIKLCEVSDAVSSSDTGSETNSETNSDNNESVIEDEDIHNDDKKSDYEIEEDTSDNEDNDSECDTNEELETIAKLEELENVCVDHNDINDYYKEQFIKDKQSNSLSLSGVFRGWY